MGDKMLRCPVGIDVERLIDHANSKKTCDVLIYDKIYWNRDETVPKVLDRLLFILEKRGLNYEILRYGSHTQDEYFDKLKHSRSMAFLSAHKANKLGQTK